MATLARVVATPPLQRLARAYGQTAQHFAPPTIPPLKYFSAWFCPYAQRATIALQHHAVPHVLEEALGWTITESTVGEQGRTEEAAYHWKSPALLAANPAGMVPTLLEEGTGLVVKESLVAVEFVNEYAIMHGSKAPSLMPRDPFERARARVWAAQVNSKACSPYYAVLCKPTRPEQLAAFEGLVGSLRQFGEELGGRKFFCGDSLSLTDVALLPWAYRFYVLEHYRGSDFAIPRDGDLLYYHRWLERCLELPAVQSSCPDKEKYLEHIKKYATNSARSKVANAVRRGAQAHEYGEND
ncbi:glutathione S-transferase [Pavlovales sp. CCMP2436]|nr:glutathione S-transferase [Pavlovales sp. CCMP2436]|mmetsp:Transcript_36504/g.91049  ORF Transcript_36504/g.91049 Transcript_36504/m.91049 type:complete len:298 (-) Transcript_36504:61-954(-)|eukprot:CAMPEP_0179923726 /NCGR_PEP_ID=MMETSP0983-20121128/6332_1 /TAXON_ID=483367 /ORGANISM="non described non described, Strain CCMP 2436" /LENGTH=297 /DNA_ID=CAMNT_0021827171 /DNA_START=1 /DNA_END=894 /DNA_ORIENTATION=+